jgi:hypothetical protein
MKTSWIIFSASFVSESNPTKQSARKLMVIHTIDGILQPFPKGSAQKNYDAIVYPSVAWHHEPNNIAILPETIDSQFTLIEAEEFQVIQTWYDKEIAQNEMPASLQSVRKPVQFKSGNIIWDDD